MTDSINTITAANLRAVADLLDQHPDLPQPYIVSSSDGTMRLSWYLTLDHIGGSDQKADAAAIVKAIDGGWRRCDSTPGSTTAEWAQSRDGLRLLVQVTRDAVCERVVVGTETVTIPAVEAKPARTEARDVVEWRCQPLLTEATTS